MMAFDSAHRLRALVLILSLVFGLVGMTFASGAMAMQPETGSAVGMAAPSTDPCPGCGGIDDSKAMAVHCAVGLCSGAGVVLPTASETRAISRAAFPMVAQSEGRGITISPALGPPRALHLT